MFFYEGFTIAAFLLGDEGELLALTSIECQYKYTVGTLSRGVMGKVE